MWKIRNETPYATERTWARDINGVHIWIVVVKATFDIKPDGALSLSDRQLEPLLAPEYIGEPGLSSLRYDADLVPAKPTTDILLNATAYAPGGRPSVDFLVEARIAGMRKIVRVRGIRAWSYDALDNEPSAPEPVTQLPIRYERAYGGHDETDPDPRNQKLDLRNPVGCGVATRTSHLRGRLAPNFEYPSGTIEKTGPAGFGPIASFWSPRREWSGTYDQEWQEKRLPLLPLDWDPRSLLCSPKDQQPDRHLRGDEQVELVNLTPNGYLCFTLPRIHFNFSTRVAGRIENHRSQIASVIIEPDHPRVIIVWQSCLPCVSGVDYLDETTVREKRNI